MAYQEYVQKAIATGKTYDELPVKVKGAVPLPEWKTRVRELCVQQGLAWDVSQAHSVCNELEYYESLISTYQAWGRLYPYHLAEYVARVLRVTPFRYYVDLLFLCLKEERSYDRVPNFTAADALRLTGVGRNEYISILNACKSKRLMWRINKGLARELLPTAPPDIRLQPWWRVCVVNVGESEFRDLGPDESSLLRAAADAPRPLPVSAFDPQLLQHLYKRGLIYLHIPINPDDKFSIPPLEGFVSNKTSEAGDESVDPLEPLLYRLFLANSSRLDQARLADILGTDLQQLQTATSLAVRLGFATRLNASSMDDMPAAAAAPARAASSSSVSALSSRPQAEVGSTASGAIPDSLLDEVAPTAAGREAPAEAVGLWGPGEGAAAAGGGGGGAAAAAGGGGPGSRGDGAVAVVVDAETTSFLMMGALSSGLKRHSVSLFEGGRVSGEAVMDELIAELQASAAAGALFEGEDMAQLMRVIESLGLLLACVKEAVAAQGHQLELLRQESFAGLDPLSAAKVLSATYTAIIPISPLPGHTLPQLLCRQLLQQQPGPSRTSSTDPSSSIRRTISLPAAAASPSFFGPPSPEADSPWLQLALYAAARAGPVSLVFVAGSRVWRLPAQLQGCTHALLWGWGPAAATAGGAAADTRPLLVEGSNLLCTLNELLCRTAVLVQPLVHQDQLPPPPSAAVPAAQQQHLVRFVDVPLPLCPCQPAPARQHSTNSSSAGGGAGSAAQQQQQPGGQGQAEDASPAAPVLLGPQQQTSWDPFGLLGSGQAGTADGHALGQQQQQQQQRRQQQQHPVIVQAVERTGATAGLSRQLQVPGQVVAALHELQLSTAVGWLRLVRLPPPAATSSGGLAGQKQPWVPLSANLGVPLFCPTLCRLVCDNMSQQQCLTEAGQAAWRAAQQQLQLSLAEHVGAVDDSYGGDYSSRASTRGSSGQLGALSTAGGQGPAGSAGMSMAGAGVQLPSHGLLFDGHSLLPVDVGGCLQGVQLW